LVVAIGFLFLTGGNAWADDVIPEVPADAHHLSLMGDQGEEMGSADVVASYGPTPGTVTMKGWVKDTKSDSRCVYINYKVVTAHGHDPDGKLVRVCGNGDEDYGDRATTAIFFNVHQRVEFKLCREQGLGRDRCTGVESIDI
jgi:hypothetical protein